MHGSKSPDLGNKALEAVKFLESEFEKPSHPRLRAITSQGTEMNSITFRSEKLDDKVKGYGGYIIHCIVGSCGRRDSQ